MYLTRTRHATRALSPRSGKATIGVSSPRFSQVAVSITAMSVVLPGDVVPARRNTHSALKLGPGLLQISSPAVPSGDGPIIATRPGLLMNTGGKQWWVQRNLVRASLSISRSICLPLNAANFLTVHAKHWGIRRWHHNRQTFEWFPSGHRLCSPGFPR